MNVENIKKERNIGYLLKLVNDKLRTNADANLLEHDLTLSQSRILRFLNEKGGCATQKDIEDYLQVSHPTVTGLIARMKEKGFVECSKDQKDRRNTIVTITEKAVALGADLCKMIAENEKKMLRSLSEQQIFELEDTLTTIYNNLGEMENE